MRLADLGVIAKDADHPYYGSELEAADKRRLAERQRVHDITQAQKKHQATVDADTIRRKAEYEQTRRANPTKAPEFERVQGGGGAGDTGPRDPNAGKGGWDTHSRVDPDWQQTGRNTPTQVHGGPAPAHHPHAPVSSSSGHLAPTGAPKVKVPKITPRGKVAGGALGLGALTTGAAALAAKRSRDL